jgi:hypothetical protein
MRLRLRLDDLTWQELDGEIVVLDLRGSAYFQLNGAGTHLWRRLVDGCQRPDLERSLVEHYDVDRERAEADVETFLSDLRAHRLLDPNSR